MTARCGRAWRLERIISENPHPDLTGWIRTLGRIHRESRAAVYGVYKEAGSDKLPVCIWPHSG